MSFPPVVLKWYINSDSADSTSVSDQSEEMLQIDSKQRQNHAEANYFVQRNLSNTESYYKYRLISEKHLTRGQIPLTQKQRDFYTFSKLNFTVSLKHLKEGRVRLKCSASVLDLYWKSVQVNPQVMDKPLWFERQFSRSQERVCLTCFAFILNIFAQSVFNNIFTCIFSK